MQVDLADSEEIRVQSGDHVGFTTEASYGVISFQYVQNHKTYFRTVENSGRTDYPLIGNTYMFDNIFLPATFSIAMQIDPGKSGEMETLKTRH